MCDLMSICGNSGLGPEELLPCTVRMCFRHRKNRIHQEAAPLVAFILFFSVLNKLSDTAFCLGFNFFGTKGFRFTACAFY